MAESDVQQTARRGKCFMINTEVDSVGLKDSPNRFITNARFIHSQYSCYAYKIPKLFSYFNFNFIHTDLLVENSVLE